MLSSSITERTDCFYVVLQPFFQSIKKSRLSELLESGECQILLWELERARHFLTRKVPELFVTAFMVN
jgi:hypothetical protein